MKTYLKLTREVRDLVHLGLTGNPYDPSSIHTEKFLADHLAETVGDFVVGEIGLEELREVFGQNVQPSQFDLEQWLNEKAEEGHFDFT